MKSVLITGGTGSFGNAFTRRLLKDGTERICIFSRCEVRQAEMASELRDDRRLRFFIGDVRDKDRLRRAMEGVEVVVHAAALKRIEVGYYNPAEMVKTNIGGAINVIEAAHDAQVKKVIALSTDKAFRPVSPYGYSKALAESIFLASNNTRGSKGPRFAVTRYGNIFGSRGSVYPTWQRLLALGRRQDITISDPECTRFYMRMDEALDLVLQTIERMPAEIAIPRLPAYRLGDLAGALGLKQPRITGLPIWEKRHESMSEDQCSETAPRMTIDDLQMVINGSAMSPLTQSLNTKATVGKWSISWRTRIMDIIRYFANG